MTISKINTPKLYISDFMEYCPRIAYSGAMYPLKDNGEIYVIWCFMQNITLLMNTDSNSWNWIKNISTTYYVPTTRFVVSCDWSPPKSLAKPKSEILGLISASNRTLLAFRSRWTTFNRESSCRYCTPRAIPFIMPNLLLQSSCFRFSESVAPMSSKHISILWQRSMILDYWTSDIVMVCI